MGSWTHALFTCRGNKSSFDDKSLVTQVIRRSHIQDVLLKVARTYFLVNFHGPLPYMLRKFSRNFKIIEFLLSESPGQIPSGAAYEHLGANNERLHLYQLRNGILLGYLFFCCGDGKKLKGNAKNIYHADNGSQI